MTETSNAKDEPTVEEQRWEDSKGRQFHAKRPFERFGNTYRLLQVKLPTEDAAFKVYQVWKPRQGPSRPAGWYKTAGALADEIGGTVFTTAPCPECGTTSDPESDEPGAVRGESDQFEPGGERYLCTNCDTLLSTSWMETDYLPPEMDNAG